MTLSKKRLWIEIFLLGILLVLVTIVLRGAYRQYMKTSYPLEYSDWVESYAAQYEFPPSLVYAIIRTESGFDPDAYSSAGARGLMQITDSTFTWAQNREHAGEHASPEVLFDPETNIRYGVYVLSLLRELYPVTDTTLAAYNGGLGNVRDWLQDPACSSDGETLHTIPFTETREYVQKVRDAQKIYQTLYEIQ